MTYISAVIGHILNPIAEFVTPMVIPTKEAKPETGKHPLTAEIIISKWSI